MFKGEMHLKPGRRNNGAQGMVTPVRVAMLAFALAPGASWAGQLDYTLYAGLEHSNNITLSSTDPISQNVLIPGFNFIYTQQGATVQANVAGTLEYHAYLGDQFDNQTQTQLSGHVNWTILPSRLDFSFDDSAGVQPVNSLASNAPGNQQQTNVIAVGPTLHLDFSEALRGQVELRYINSYASKIDDFNSSRGLAAFRVYHDINPTDQISLNAETQRVLADNTTPANGVVGSDNYTRNELYARYLKQLADFRIDAQAGWTAMQFDSSRDQSSPMGRLTLTWSPTLRSTLDVEGAYQYSDAAQDMLLPPGQALGQASSPVLPQSISNAGNLSVGNTVVNSQTYLERVVQATYSFHTERWSVSVSPMYNKLEYINGATFNQSGRGGTFRVDYRPRPTLTVSTFVSAENLKYTSLDRTDKTHQYGVDLSKQWTQHWSSRASFIRQSRQSDAIGQAYTENQLYFALVYKR